MRGLFFFFVVMMICIPPVCALQHDAVLKYDAGDSGGAITGTYGMRPWGHAVLFKNPDTITITGIQIYGCKFGTGDKKIFVEIWDKDLKQLYRDAIALDQIPVGVMDVSQNNCGAVASWADIPLPNHAVTGDFYMAVFTYSPKPNATAQGLNIGYTYPSSTATSHTVREIPNTIDDITLAQRYNPTQIDWTIRTYYTKTVATTASTTIATTMQPNTPVTTTAVPAVTSQTPDQASPAPAGNAESTKADIGTGLVVSSLVISLIVWKRT